jgi:HPt (histidine-containing phosphotransfer) domain-containing protein
MNTSINHPTDSKSIAASTRSQIAVTQDMGRIASAMATVPGMAVVLRDFITGLSADVERLLDASRRNDLIAMRRGVHHLRGACGGYGFDALSVRAAEVEAMFHASSERPAIDAGVSSLIELVRRVDGFGSAER